MSERGHSHTEYNMFVDTPSTLKSKSVMSLLKAPVSPEGWNGLSELTGSWRGRKG